MSPLLSLALATLLACSAPAPELPAAWATVPAPPGGEVIPEASGDLHIQYTGTTRTKVWASWKVRLESDGYEVGEPAGVGPMISGTVRKGDQQLEFLVSGTGDKIDALLYPRR